MLFKNTYRRREDWVLSIALLFSFVTLARSVLCGLTLTFSWMTWSIPAPTAIDVSILALMWGSYVFKRGQDIKNGHTTTKNTDMAIEAENADT